MNKYSVTHDQLISELLDPRIFKTQREHSAAREIKKLRQAIAEKEELIKALHEDISYYRKDRKDQMIQDQGLEE